MKMERLEGFQPFTSIFRFWFPCVSSHMILQRQRADTCQDLHKKQQPLPLLCAGLDYHNISAWQSPTYSATYTKGVGAAATILSHGILLVTAPEPQLPRIAHAVLHALFG